MSTTINRTHIAKLKQQRRTVGMLQFECKDDQNFSKWYSLTQNLVIKAFGQKSNQVQQLRSIYMDMLAGDDYDYIAPKRLKTKEAKEKLKNLLSVFMDELELDFEVEPKSKQRKSGNISVKMENTQTVNQTLDVSVVIEKVIDNIRQKESDPQRVAEAELRLKELEDEINSKSPAWSKVKDILIWLLNFGRDAFVQVLPIILEKYKQ